MSLIHFKPKSFRGSQHRTYCCKIDTSRLLMKFFNIAAATVSVGFQSALISNTSISFPFEGAVFIVTFTILVSFLSKWIEYHNGCYPVLHQGIYVGNIFIFKKDYSKSIWGTAIIFPFLLILNVVAIEIPTFELNLSTSILTVLLLGFEETLPIILKWFDKFKSSPTQGDNNNVNTLRSNPTEDENKADEEQAIQPVDNQQQNQHQQTTTDVDDDDDDSSDDEDYMAEFFEKYEVSNRRNDFIHVSEITAWITSRGCNKGEMDFMKDLRNYSRDHYEQAVVVKRDKSGLRHLKLRVVPPLLEQTNINQFNDQFDNPLLEQFTATPPLQTITIPIDDGINNDDQRLRTDSSPEQVMITMPNTDNMVDDNETADDQSLTEIPQEEDTNIVLLTNDSIDYDHTDEDKQRDNFINTVNDDKIKKNNDDNQIAIDINHDEVL